MMDEALEMYVIYQHPKDFPNYYVARLWKVNADGPVATQKYRVAATLDEVRGFVPFGKVRIERDPNDEPQIVEMWI